MKEKDEKTVAIWKSLLPWVSSIQFGSPLEERNRAIELCRSFFYTMKAHATDEEYDQYLAQFTRLLFFDNALVGEEIKFMDELLVVRGRLIERDRTTYLPRNTNALCFMGYAHLRAGNPREAMEYVEQAVENARLVQKEMPGAHLGDLPFALYIMAYTYEALGRNILAEDAYKDAIEAYDIASHKDPQDTSLVLTLGNTVADFARFYCALSRTSQALDRYWQAVDIYRGLLPQPSAMSALRDTYNRLLEIYTTTNNRAQCDELHRLIEESEPVVQRDSIEHTDAYKNINAIELGKSIKLYYSDYRNQAQKKRLPNFLHVSDAVAYWDAKQVVLFEQYGLMWQRPYKLNPFPIDKSLCEMDTNEWNYVYSATLFGPENGTRWLKPTHLCVMLSYTVHDFGSVSTMGTAQTIPLSQIKAGDNLILHFDSFYRVFGNIIVSSVVDGHIEGTYEKGQFSVSRDKQFESSSYAIGGYTSGTVALEMKAIENVPMLPGADSRRLKAMCYVRGEDESFTLSEVITLLTDDIPDNYIAYSASNSCERVVIRRIVCHHRNEAGITGQIVLNTGHVRNFALRNGEFYRFLFPHVYVKLMLDDNSTPATLSSCVGFFRYASEEIDAIEGDKTVHTPDEGVEPCIVSASQIINV